MQYAANHATYLERCPGSSEIFFVDWSEVALIFHALRLLFITQAPSKQVQNIREHCNCQRTSELFVLRLHHTITYVAKSCASIPWIISGLRESESKCVLHVHAKRAYRWWFDAYRGTHTGYNEKPTVPYATTIKSMIIWLHSLFCHVHWKNDIDYIPSQSRAWWTAEGMKLS